MCMAYQCVCAAQPGAGASGGVMVMVMERIPPTPIPPMGDGEHAAAIGRSMGSVAKSVVSFGMNAHTRAVG